MTRRAVYELGCIVRAMGAGFLGVSLAFVVIFIFGGPALPAVATASWGFLTYLTGILLQVAGKSGGQH